MKKYLIIMLVLTNCICAFGQRLMVEALSIQDNGKAVEKKDLNGKPCALIRVYSPDIISKVEGNVIGETEKTRNMYNIYMTEGSKQVNLIFGSHLPLQVHFTKIISQPLKGNTTYDLVFAENHNDIDLETQLNGPTDPKEQMELYDKYIENGNEKTALYWLRKAACQNNLGAVNELAELYKEGTYVDRDPKKAFYWSEKDAELDNTGWGLGLTQLAECYKEGIGVDVDYKKAFILLEQGGKNNYLGQYLLGYLYWEGLGTDKDIQKAVECFKLSADFGYVNAEYNLGYYYFTEAKDEKQGVYWMQRASDHGSVEASMILKQYKQYQESQGRQ